MKIKFWLLEYHGDEMRNNKTEGKESFNVSRIDIVLQLDATLTNIIISFFFVNNLKLELWLDLNSSIKSVTKDTKLTSSIFIKKLFPSLNVVFPCI